MPIQFSFTVDAEDIDEDTESGMDDTTEEENGPEEDSITLTVDICVQSGSEWYRPTFSPLSRRTEAIIAQIGAEVAVAYPAYTTVIALDSDISD